uniref:Uncharacterized protein n=1 Tax=Rhizophora mucronata TaxID=61149 RepID=A0A2P2N4Z0_RHIMU
MLFLSGNLAVGLGIEEEIGNS